ncbi:MAG: 16S rRNA (adenine(1518)-N(6)/adenine(1519)-N(6))-dimethyltransferase RsmA [Thermoplasmata archaeon]
MVGSIKNKLIELGIRPSKKMGQNFLSDVNIAEKQVKAADLDENDTVLEIGPGIGTLTEEIVERVGEAILVEKDEVLYGYLEGRYGSDDVEIIQADILDVELSDLPPFNKIVSNIPFNISSPLTFKLLEYDFDCAILMYQKEYAERLVAKMGEENYSRLSVMVSTKAKVQRLFTVPRHCFYPPPNVDAEVVELIPTEPDFDLHYPEAFSAVVRELFNYRRKMIKNALKNGFDIEIKDCPFQKYRVENLSPEEICRIVDYLVEEGLIDEKPDLV